MSNKDKIIIVEKDITSQQLLKSIFLDYDVEIVDSGEKALELVLTFVPGVIILDILLPGMNGYETCKKLKNIDSLNNTALFVLTEYVDLDGRMNAYGAGADEYFSKPFDLLEFKSKVERLFVVKNEKKELVKELQASYDIALNMQKNASKIQVISRFLEANLCCHDVRMLVDLFFKTANELESSCVIHIKLNDETLILSDNGIVHKLEAEILKMSDKLDRIHSFGKERSVFNWRNVSVLVRNIGENIDIMAILMNGLEAGIRSIETESSLLTLVNDLGNQNNFIQDNISGLFSEMKVSLRDTFLALGMVASLDVDDEDELNDQVDHYQKLIKDQLAQLNINNDRISFLIETLKSIPDQEKEEDDINGVSLF